MLVFLFKQKSAYEVRISDWSSDVCSSDLLHPRGAAALHTDFARRGGADVDHAAARKGAAVVDADDHAVAVRHVGDAHHAAKGQRAVRGGELAGVETLAVRGAVAGEFVAVIARHAAVDFGFDVRSEEHTSELQSLMRISYAVFCLQKKNKDRHNSVN